MSGHHVGLEAHSANILESSTMILIIESAAGGGGNYPLHRVTKPQIVHRRSAARYTNRLRARGRGGARREEE